MFGKTYNTVNSASCMCCPYSFTLLLSLRLLLLFLLRLLLLMLRIVLFLMPALRLMMWRQQSTRILPGGILLTALAQHVKSRGVVSVWTQCDDGREPFARAHTEKAAWPIFVRACFLTRSSRDAIFRLAPRPSGAKPAPVPWALQRDRPEPATIVTACLCDHHLSVCYFKHVGMCCL